MISADDFLNLYNENTAPSKFSETAYMSPRLFGGPYAYTPQVDPRIAFTNITDTTTVSAIGRTMASTLMANPTIVSITPGKVKPKSISSVFSSGITAADIIGSSNDDAAISSIASKMENEKYFYNFRSAWSDYANIVNLLCRSMAIMLGIGNKPVMGYSQYTYESFNYMDWQYKNVSGANSKDSLDLQSGSQSVLRRIFSYFEESMDNILVNSNQYVHFYAGTSTDSSDNMSTSTRESSIQSKFEAGFDDTMKDVQYLFGDVTSSMTNSMMDDIKSAFNDSGVGDASGWMNLLGKGIGYLNGSRMVFPLMVDDFTYGKDITVNCRFVSPSGDPESIFLNCYVPAAFVLAFSLPRQIDEANNMYKSPLLVKAVSKGFFNTDLGVVTSCRLQRGGPDNMSWTSAGLPTEIETSFDITPLYTNLMLSNTKGVNNFLANDGLIEYLGTLCGANIKGDAFSIKIAMIKSMLQNKVTDIPNNIQQAIKDSALVQFINNIKNLP